MLYTFWNMSEYIYGNINTYICVFMFVCKYFFSWDYTVILCRVLTDISAFMCSRFKCLDQYMSTRTHTYIHTYIHAYCHSQTDCFVVWQFFNVARHVGRLKLGSKPAQLYVRLSIIPLSHQANHVSSGIIRHYVVGFVCLHFCLTWYQSAQFIRSALLMRVGAVNSFTRVLNPNGGAYIA